MTDMVNKPAHYQGEIECIDYIKDRLSGEQYIGYLTGAAMKYLHRWQHKGKPEEDLAKAMWYIERLKEYIGKQPANLATVDDKKYVEKMNEDWNAIDKHNYMMDEQKRVDDMMKNLRAKLFPGEYIDE